MKRRYLTARQTLGRAALCSALLISAGCAHVKPAPLERPAELAEASESSILGIGHGRRGSFNWGTLQVQYERSADRLAVFDAVNLDRAALEFNTTHGDGTRSQARCQFRRSEASLGVITSTLRPLSVQCQWSGLPLALNLQAISESAGTRTAHRGELRVGSQQLQLHSVHRLQGSALPLPNPGGYVIEQDGRAIALLDLTDSVPRVLISAGVSSPSLTAATAQAALALALLWDPAKSAP